MQAWYIGIVFFFFISQLHLDGHGWNGSVETIGLTSTPKDPLQSSVIISPVNMPKVTPTPIRSPLYWNITASSLNEFGLYAVNRMIKGLIIPRV